MEPVVWYQNLAIILAMLWFISEALDQIPAIKASSIFQAIKNGLKFLWEKSQTPPDPKKK